MKRIAVVLLLAQLSSCAILQSPNARYTYQRTGADCTLTVDSGRAFSAGVDVQLKNCDVQVTAGKVEAPKNDLKDVLDLAKILKGGGLK